MTDAELVNTFVAEGCTKAFDELVSRHGSMVFRTCRRILRNHQDAEDATQAVFTTLAARAATLTSYRSLGGWLYSTAWNVSRRAKCLNVVRARYERHAVPRSSVHPLGRPLDEDLVELYRALRMLPPECQEAIVLHHLEGMTVAQVAELTGWSVGTTASRLSRSRALIRERLERRGIVIPTVALIGMLAGEASTEASVQVAMPTGTHIQLVAAGAAVSSPILSNVGLGGCVISAGCSMKWVVAACVVLCIGAGTSLVPHVVGARTAEDKRSSVVASSSLQAKHTSAGKASNDDDEDHNDDVYRRSFESTRSSTSWQSETSVPEPSVLSLLALAALAARRRR